MPADEPPVEVERVLKETRAEILVNYLPVGSQEATRYYARCCLAAGVSLVNCIPEFIASSPEWAQKFEQKGSPSSETILNPRWERPSFTGSWPIFLKKEALGYCGPTN